MTDFQTLALMIVGGGFAVFAAIVGLQLRRGVAFRKLPVRR